MSPQYYQKLTGDNLVFNEFYGLLKNTSKDFENDITKSLTIIPSIGSVSYRSNTYIDFNKSMKSLNSVVLILILSAGVLAFVVIYNLTNINISERRRELCYEGHQLFDLARTNRDLTRVDFAGAVNQNVPAGDYKWAMPIPQEEIDTNPNCKQNPGYGSN